MNNLFIILIILLLVACDKEPSASPNNSTSPESDSDESNNHPTLDATDLVDYGDVLPIRNFPLNWTYIEYPTINKDGLEFISLAPCEYPEGKSLIGDWVIVREFDGAFFRTEGKNANPFNAGLDYEEGQEVENSNSYTKVQKQSIAHHFHHHKHTHNHEVNDTHTHEHQHPHKEHRIWFGADHRGANREPNSEKFIDYLDGEHDDETHDITLQTNGFQGGECKLNDNGVCGTQSTSIVIATYDGTLTTADTITTPNIIDQSNDETRPSNYTQRIWQRIDRGELFGCRQFEYVYDYQYKKVNGEKQIISSERKIDADGNLLLLELKPNLTKYQKLTEKRYKFTNENNTKTIVSRKTEEKVW